MKATGEPLLLQKRQFQSNYQVYRKKTDEVYNQN